MPKEFKIKAVSGKQKGQSIFTGVLEAADLIAVTTIDPYNSRLKPDDLKQGYQRPPERTRITKIGSYLIKNIVEDAGGAGSGLFPNAVTLAARTPLSYDPDTLTLTLSTDQKLQIVDGQHRIEGLRYAIEEKNVDYLRDFPIPFVIMEAPSRAVEMAQFRTINGTAKAVRTDLVNSIITAIGGTGGAAAVDSQDRWRVVITKVVDKLDRSEESPWRNLILMPDQKKGDPGTDSKIMRATSFMTSLKPIYQSLEYLTLVEDRMSLDKQADVMYSIVAPYWDALMEVVPDAFADPKVHVIQKTPGLFSLHKLLDATLIPQMIRTGEGITRGNFAGRLSASPEITDADFWHKDSERASAYGSMKGFQALFELLRDSLD
jgi:DGQHR domain-containing protein